jgi:membrane-bound metal-dependent hydrolase YbcI (DUF457 family)
VFIGHFAVALAAKRAAPAVSLGTLFLAAQLADLVWPTLVLLGIESFSIRPGLTAVTPLDFTNYPYSHSLVALAGWGLALGVAYYLMRRGGAGAVVLFFVVLSHWVLDVATHRPDMPLTIGGSARLGLGLWTSIPATVAVEGVLFAAGVWVYARATRPADGIGRWSFFGLIAFLTAVYAANIFGPPPPSVAAVAWSAQAIWLLVAWGYWIDRHRMTSRN